MNNLNQIIINHYVIQLVAENIYAIDEFGTDIIYLVIGSERAMLVDTGAGFGVLRETVEELTKKPLIVVNTHGHMDHTLGNIQFPEVFLNQKDFWMLHPDYITEEKWKKFCIKEMKEEGYVGPDLTTIPLQRQKEPIALSEGMKFELGDRTFEAIEIGGHTPGCTVFLDKENRILIGGDVIVSTPILIFDTYSTCVMEYWKNLKKLAEREQEFDLILPGHYIRPIGKKYLFDLIDCAEEILNGAAVPEKINLSHMSGEEAYIHKKGSASIIYNEKHIK